MINKTPEGHSEEATAELVARFPEWEVPIRAWYDRWEETIGGSVQGSVDVLEQLKASGQYKLYALTNWSESTFPGRWPISHSSTGSMVSWCQA